MPRLFEEFPTVAQRLMLTAERLYGQHGVDGVSLRQIVAAAGQSNNNAVPLHFGSKAGLIQAVSEMRLPPIEAERRILLAAAHRDSDRRIERMLGVLLMPLVTAMNEQDLEHYARFTLAVMRVEPEEHPFVKSADISPASMEIHAQLEDALPHLPPDVFRRRLALACSLFLSGAAQVGGKLRLSPNGYWSRQTFFQDMFGASIAVLNASFPPVADPDIHMDPRRMAGNVEDEGRADATRSPRG
jgi:AcrR family transcriptional regulator